MFRNTSNHQPSFFSPPFLPCSAMVKDGLVGCCFNGEIIVNGSIAPALVLLGIDGRA